MPEEIADKRIDILQNAIDNLYNYLDNLPFESKFPLDRVLRNAKRRVSPWPKWKQEVDFHR
jgi:hypothetical protein